MSEPTEEIESVDLLAAEFAERLRRGEYPSVTEYISRCPKLAGEIRDLFPTIVAMERWKAGCGFDTGPPSTAEPFPERMGDYWLLRQIGRGGMGVVFEAEQQSLRRLVALKILPALSMAEPRRLLRFRREAQTAARLHHTNIVPVFGAGQHEGVHYLVMQRIRGVGLDELILRLREGASNGTPSAAAPLESDSSILAGAKGGSSRITEVAASLVQEKFPDVPPPSIASGDTQPQHPSTTPTADAPLPPNTIRSKRDPKSSLDPPVVRNSRFEPADRFHWQGVAQIGLQAADAIAYAHAQGVLHRDIKPANLLLDDRGVVWITDFGLAKAEEDVAVSRTGDLVGTLRFMAPEQFHAQADARSDIYSLGLTLYELATLCPAFEDADQGRLMRKIVESVIAPPRRLRPSLPRDLETVILKAVAREPAARYASAADLASDLRAVIEDRPVQARRVSSLERTWRWARRNPVVAGLGMAVAGLLLVVAVVASAGYFHVRDANRTVRDALARETWQREKAEATSTLALEVLDSIYSQLAPMGAVETPRVNVQGDGGEAIEVPLAPALSRQAASLLENLLTFYDRLAEQGNERVQVRQETAKANRRVGAIRCQLGQYEQARGAYQRALVIYRQLDAESPDENDYRVRIAEVQNELGDLYRATEQPEQAEATHRASLELLGTRASAATMSADARYELARTHYHLATLGDFRPDRDPGSPEHRPLQARHQPPPRRPLGPPPREPGGRGQFSDNEIPGPPRRPAPQDGRPPDRQWLPDGQGPPDGPRRPFPAFAAGGLAVERREEHLRTAILVLEELVHEKPAPAYRHLLARCYRESSRSRPLDAEGLTRLTEAINILAEIVEQYPGVPDYRYDLIEAYAAMNVRAGPITSELLDGVERRLRAALELSQRLVEEYPEVPDYQVSCAHLHHKLGDVSQQAGRANEAEVAFRRAVDLQKTLVEQFPKTTSHRIWLAVFSRSLARTLLDRGESAGARKQLQESVASLEPLLRRQDAPQVRPVLAEIQTLLADAQDRLGDSEAAAETRRRQRQLRAGR